MNLSRGIRDCRLQILNVNYIIIFILGYHRSAKKRTYKNQMVFIGSFFSSRLSVKLFTNTTRFFSHKKSTCTKKSILLYFVPLLKTIVTSPVVPKKSRSPSRVAFFIRPILVYDQLLLP